MKTFFSVEDQILMGEEVMTQSSAPLHASKPAGQGVQGSKPKTQDLGAGITAVTASITGDRGNIYYGEELNKAAKSK